MGGNSSCRAYVLILSYQRLKWTIVLKDSALGGIRNIRCIFFRRRSCFERSSADVHIHSGDNPYARRIFRAWRDPVHELKTLSMCDVVQRSLLTETPRTKIAATRFNAVKCGGRYATPSLRQISISLD